MKFARSFALILLAVAACSVNKGDDTAPPEWVIGTYQYSGNGSIAKKFPWEAKADLVLERDGQYTLGVTVHVDDEKGGDTDSDESYGSYRVEGSRLILEPVNDDDQEVFDIRGDRLVPKLGWPTRLALKGFRIADPVFVKTH